MAAALRQLGVRPGDRVATLAWNTYQHLELYFAIPLAGAVLHTLNLRLAPDELRYVIDHADDRVVVADTSLVRALDPARAARPGMLVVGADGAGTDGAGPGSLDYEELMAAAEPLHDPPPVGEDDLAALCY